MAGPRRRNFRAGHGAWVACAVLLLVGAGCSVEMGFEQPSPLEHVPPECVACRPADKAPPAKEAPAQEAKAEEAKRKDSADKPEESAKEPAKPPKPHTVWQAFGAYRCCVRSHLNGTAPDTEEDKEGAKEGGKNGNGAKKDKGKKNAPAENGDKGKANGNGKENEKGPERSGKKNPDAKETLEKDGGKEKGPERSGKKNPDTDEAGGKADGEKGEEGKKDEEKDTEKEKEPDAAWYSAHAQATMVTQEHPRFRSPYVGQNSLLPGEPSATSMTGTLFLDYRLCESGGNTTDLVFNPEISGGRGLSGVVGVGGFPNGEITRVGTVEPTPYVARLFLRETIACGDEMEKVEDAPNAIAGTRPVNRLTFTIGKLAATDVVDDNLYSHDPRTQFLNWSLMYNGAWDYPANVRGYDYGFAFDYNTHNWAVRYGVFAEPEIANGAPIDPMFLKAQGQVAEWEERYTLNCHPGKLRLLAYLNRAHMGDYQEALAEMPVKPDVTKTRDYRFKYGFGLNFEQELTKELGLWGRLGWNDGHTESWAFTEIDRTAALGLALKGKCWCRPDDVVGLAAVINGLSPDHYHYLEAGGLGFIIGDGRLRYAPEEILETYYDLQIIKGIFVTADWQGIDHPAYNRDRGPVAVGTLRIHIEF